MTYALGTVVGGLMGTALDRALGLRFNKPCSELVSTLEAVSKIEEGHSVAGSNPRYPHA